jgi:hypothetical protein
LHIRHKIGRKNIISFRWGSSGNKNVKWHGISIIFKMPKAIHTTIHWKAPGENLGNVLVMSGSRSYGSGRVNLNNLSSNIFPSTL